MEQRIGNYACPGKRSIFCLTSPLNISRQKLERWEFSSLIRCWLHKHGFSSPGDRQLEEFYVQVYSQSGYPTLNLSSAVIRYFRQMLYLTIKFSENFNINESWNLNSMMLVADRLKLSIRPAEFGGLDIESLTKSRCFWKSRVGGEKIQLPKRNHNSSLKKLWQERAIPYWERKNIPILWADDEVAWAFGIGPAASFLARGNKSGYLPEFSITMD